MHAFSILAWAIFVAGYITARWDLVTRVCELWTFAWDYGVVVRLGCLAPPQPTLSAASSNQCSTPGPRRQGVCVPHLLLRANPYPRWNIDQR